MNQKEVQMVANRSLAALNDNRTMVSADAVESLTDLKNILRQLMGGQLLLVDSPAAQAAQAGDAEPKSDE